MVKLHRDDAPEVDALLTGHTDGCPDARDSLCGLGGVYHLVGASWGVWYGVLIHLGTQTGVPMCAIPSVGSKEGVYHQYWTRNREKEAPPMLQTSHTYPKRINNTRAPTQDLTINTYHMVLPELDHINIGITIHISYPCPEACTHALRHARVSFFTAMAE